MNTKTKTATIIAQHRPFWVIQDSDGELYNLSGREIYGTPRIGLEGELTYRSTPSSGLWYFISS